MPWNNPEYTLVVNTRLYTRDGRRIGNAIVTGHDTVDGLFYHKIKTDFGNEANLTHTEIRDLFWTGSIADKTHKHFKEILDVEKY